MFKGQSKTQPSSSAKLAIIYITIGALLLVWSVIWALYLFSHRPVSDYTWYWCLGFLLTGVTLIGIGMAVGNIGRSARRADTDHAGEQQEAPAPPPVNINNNQPPVATPAPPTTQPMPPASDAEQKPTYQG